MVVNEAPAQKKIAAQQFLSSAAAKRLREDDNDGNAEALQARFKSPIFALGPGVLVVVPFIDYY
jgi:hypothetical protein